ncbi:MAG: hypothetical protein OXE52_01275 [Chloroflexi bacterium]|nr:hypothetical protein [Chloroflexota bacterium]
MSSVEHTTGQHTSILERLSKVETTLETERPHLATKADLERQTRLIVMWMIATQIAVVGLILSVVGNWISMG